MSDHPLTAGSPSERTAPCANCASTIHGEIGRRSGAELVLQLWNEAAVSQIVPHRGSEEGEISAPISGRAGICDDQTVVQLYERADGSIHLPTASHPQLYYLFIAGGALRLSRLFVKVLRATETYEGKRR